MPKCSKCDDTGWCPWLEPLGAMCVKVDGIWVNCDCKRGEPMSRTYKNQFGPEYHSKECEIMAQIGEDYSWGNDTHPCFLYNGWFVWIDAEDPQMREMGAENNPRFTVCHAETVDNTEDQMQEGCAFQTEDFKTMLHFVSGQNGKRVRPVEHEWIVTEIAVFENLVKAESAQVALEQHHQEKAHDGAVVWAQARKR